MRDKLVEWGAITLAAGWALLLPIQGLMLALGTLIGADFITGVWKSAKKRKKITSRGWRRTIGKSAIYLVAVIAGFACDYIVQNETPIIARTVSLAIALTEIKSIMENFYAVTGINLLQLVLSKFKPPEKTDDEVEADEPPAKPAKKKPVAKKKKV